MTTMKKQNQVSWISFSFLVLESASILKNGLVYVIKTFSRPLIVFVVLLLFLYFYSVLFHALFSIHLLHKHCYRGSRSSALKQGKSNFNCKIVRM